MGLFKTKAVLVLPFALLLLRSLPSYGKTSARSKPGVACADFATGSGWSWTLDNCIDVWTRFVRSVPDGLHRRLRQVDLWRESTSELRRAGSPCLVASESASDGAGNWAIRHLASWIFAEEMGCDCVTPGRAGKHAYDGNGTMIYCYRTASTQELHLFQPSKELPALSDCVVVDWLAYFHFDVASVNVPEGGDTKVVQASLRSTEEIESVTRELEDGGLANVPYDNVMFALHPSFASQHLLAVGNWDGPRRHAVRTVLHRAKGNFHQRPRPWYGEKPECAFDPTRLNVAIYVQIGRRREFEEASLKYFALLDIFMATFSEEVVRKRLAPPLFHVFSETRVPCPLVETGVFDEFPTWPVDLDQTPSWLAADTTANCPEKQAGTFFSTKRSGVFHVARKPIVLHVDADMKNAMSCMIQADSVLMGCSTFSQAAGLLTKGISLFSTDCGGPSTSHQHKTIPPLAVADRGYLWVPVAGSWSDPILASTELLSRALDDLMAAKNVQLV